MNSMLFPLSSKIPDCYSSNPLFSLLDDRMWNNNNNNNNSKDNLYIKRRGARGVMVLFTNPSARAGYDTRSIFKRSLTGLNSEFSFS